MNINTYYFIFKENMSKKHVLELLKAVFEKQRVLVIDQLYDLINTKSRVTVFRYLRELGYLTSYTHNGRYYTLPSIAQFDQDGIWHYGDIGFSSHGTLMDTLAHFITTSQAGKTNCELEKLCRTKVQNSLQNLLRPKKIAKASQAKPCLYVSPDLTISEQQIKMRSAVGSKKRLPEWMVGEILVETIRSFPVQPNIEEVMRRLSKRGSSITREQVKQVFEENALEKKNSGLIAIAFLQHCREQTARQLNPGTLFPKKPTIHLEPKESVCCCAANTELKVRKTKKREIRTMHIGHFDVHETIKICPNKQCRKVYRCTDLDCFLAPGTNFGYDVMEYIGRAVWLKSQTAREIQSDLRLNNNLRISESEITYLAKKFVHYVVLAQQDKLVEIKRFLHRGGGYFLYFDAMHPGDGAAHLMCAVAEEIAEKVKIVLGSAKLAKESTDTVVAFFRELKAKYGDPLAGICDLLASNLAAFKEVFPNVLLLICHFHLLRSIGKDFLEYETVRLQGFLKQYNVSQRLKELLQDCQQKIEENPELIAYLTGDEERCRSEFHRFPRVIQAYYQIRWILAYEQELNGYGYPFDRAEYTYLQRMKKVYNSLKEHSPNSEELTTLKLFLAGLFEDQDLQKHIDAISKKIEDFDHLRTIMQIAPTWGVRGLNDDGEECDMPLMETELKAFIDSESISKNPDKAYIKLGKQFKKYWKMLFSRAVDAKLPSGEIVKVYPQRTTNLMERFFRDVQRCEYKRTGMGTLGRTVRAMVAETPLMKNLECPEFLNIILNGTPTLAARFAQLDQLDVQREVRNGKTEDILSPGLRRAMSKSDFYKVFTSTKKTKKKGCLNQCLQGVLEVSGF